MGVARIVCLLSVRSTCIWLVGFTSSLQASLTKSEKYSEDMQWISKSSTARSFEGKWSPKIRPPYEDPEDLEYDIPLVFRKPSWQLRACLASVLITPVLYQLYLIMVTIRYILFLQTFSCESSEAHRYTRQ